MTHHNEISKPKKKRSLKTFRERKKQHIKRICNHNDTELLFHSNNRILLKGRKLYTAFKIQCEIKFQPRILYPAKLSIKYMSNVTF